MAFEINLVILIIKKELNCEPIYNLKFLKTRTMFYSDDATDFYDKDT